jgi:peptidoglycan/LPS O-acetylase OafA/YrhL
MANRKAAPLVDSSARHSLPYMPQLDSLRALAVLLVIYHHYVPAAGYSPFGIDLTPVGARCFFVLSGFLITSILLRDIDRAPSFKLAYGVFLGRRALRLYPLLLVALVVTAILDFPHVRESFVWNLVYATNIYMATLPAWPEAMGHLWTLSVEEQFYLVWPLVLFIVPRRYLPRLIVAMIAGCLIFRFAWREFGPSFVGAEVLTPSAFDALGLGALLALYPKDRVLIARIGAIGACLWIVTAFAYYHDGLPHGWPTAIFYLNQMAASMAFVWLVKQLADGVPGIVGKLLTSPPVVYVGTISYGIYIIHQFAPYLLGLAPISLPIDQYYIVCLVITLVLASLSWHLLESPIMRAGRRWLKKETGLPVTEPAKQVRTRRTSRKPVVAGLQVHGSEGG